VCLAPRAGIRFFSGVERGAPAQIAVNRPQIVSSQAARGNRSSNAFLIIVRDNPESGGRPDGAGFILNNETRYASSIHSGTAAAIERDHRARASHGFDHDQSERTSGQSMAYDPRDGPAQELGLLRVRDFAEIDIAVWREAA